MKHLRGYVTLLIIVGLALALPSCSDNPTETPDTVANQATAQIDPNQTGGILLGTVATGSSYAPVEVWAQNLTVESDEFVSFDAVIINKCRCPIEAPIYFVITSVEPADVQVENEDFEGADGPVFDFSDDLGGDHVLDPLEASEPVKIRFSWPEPMAFAIGFRVDAGPAVDGAISGVVFNDLDLDGERDDGEPGIPRIIVEMRPSAREILYRATTDPNGRYVFSNLTADVYHVEAKESPSMVMQPTTSNPLIVTLVELPDGTVSDFERADFGFQVEGPIPPGAAIFGPVHVGPGSPNGTELDSTFVVPLFFAPVEFFLVVAPPPILGPLPIRIDSASVAIDGQTVWEFVCEYPDTIDCAPWA
ncbi:MAG: SdrD B-like domain-containing protein, partial [Candidatus Latescibacterota bacterium]